jgi:hypothetical protein
MEEGILTDRPFASEALNTTLLGRIPMRRTTGMMDIHYRTIQQNSHDYLIPWGSLDCHEKQTNDNYRSSLVSRACGSCRSHLRILHVASPPKWPGRPLNYSPADKVASPDMFSAR